MTDESKKEVLEFKKITLWKFSTIILAILFLISIFTYGFRGAPDYPTGAAVVKNDQIIPNQEPIIKADISLKGEPCKGDKDAEVTIIEFSDYQCPFCTRYFQQTFPEIEKLIKEGKVRYCFKDYVLPFHPQAGPASIAANCADEQNKYWEMHDLLFEKDEWKDGDPTEALLTYAKELKLDEKDFKKCFENPKNKDEIDEDFQEGAKAGVEGTPSFFINGQLLVGAQPWMNFKEIIDKELTK